MARAQSTHLRASLKELFGDETIRNLASESGFVQRQRKIDAVAFFWTLVFGFSASTERSIAGLRRTYELATGTTLVPSSFYDRFNDRLVCFLRRAVDQSLGAFRAAWCALDERLDAFHDLVLVDSSVLKLHDALSSVFPGCRTNSAPAAAKLHLVLSVLGKGDSTVAVTPERCGDLRKLRVGPWARGRLLLFDLGYFRYSLFRSIDRNKGFFLTRLKDGANPLITKAHHAVRGNSIALEGRRLLDVFAKLRREVLDVEVEAEFEQRAYRGKKRRGRVQFRLVAVRDETTGTYHAYVTNVPQEMLFAQELARLYRLRWEVELIFKELKSGYRLDEIGSRRRAVAESLILAAVLSLIVSRRMLCSLVERAQIPAERATSGRWWRLLAHWAPRLLDDLIRPCRYAAFEIDQLLEHELVDPHRRRKALLAQPHF